LNFHNISPFSLSQDTPYGVFCQDIFANGITTLPITRRPEQQCRLKRQSQRFSKLHLSFFASAVCNNVNL